MKARVLIVDDKENMRRLLAQVLGEVYDVVTAKDGHEALAQLTSGAFDVVLSDVRMPGPDGFAVLEHVRRNAADTEVILMTAHGSISSAVDAIRSGAYDYLAKPFEPEDAVLTVGRAVERRALRHEAASLRRRLHGESGFGELVGTSTVMLDVYDRISRAAATDLTVLITGETGTGKELVARAIHEHSARRAGPFVAVNCGALPEQLIESELFGHARGAFTGATAARAGLFEDAAGGTLLLDEIGELSLSMQVKLNRALEERQIRRVGETQARPVDVRIIAATLRDLKAEAQARRFREDLLYRLDILSIILPPLRERSGDLPLLMSHVLARIAARTGKTVPSVAPEALRVLLDWRWPGNVRELVNVLERLMAMTGADEITAAALPAELKVGGSGSSSGGAGLTSLPFRAAMELVEGQAARRYLTALLGECDGNVTRAAERAGIERESLHRLLKRYGLRSQDFK